jgi:hypothetical protein
MSFSFVGTGSAQYVAMSAGGTGAMGTGAFTIAVLWQTINDIGAFADRAAVSLLASSTAVRDIVDVDRAIYGVNDFSSGYGPLPTKTWYVAAICKPSGSALYREHLWAYNSSLTGSMTHGTSTGAANQGDGSTITSIRIGDDASSVHTNGLIAVAGLWASELSDAQLDTLVSANLSSWAALSPQALITGNNWNGSTGSTDVVGTSTQQSLVGTIGVGAEPPSFNYSLASAIPAPWLKF